MGIIIPKPIIKKPLGASVKYNKIIDDEDVQIKDEFIKYHPPGDSGSGDFKHYLLDNEDELLGDAQVFVPSDDEIKKPLGASSIYEKIVSNEKFDDIQLYTIKSNQLTGSESNTYYNNNVGGVYSFSGNEFNTAVIDESIGGAYVYTQNEIINGNITSPLYQLQDFRTVIRNRIKSNSTAELLSSVILSNSPDYSEKNIEKRVNLGDPGKSQGKNLKSYTVGSGGGAASTTGNGSFDKINASTIYQSEGAKYGDENNDLVKFVIGSMDGTNPNLQVFMHFRAFLGSISDNYTGNWDSVNYVGRGENFYNYTGFDRKVSLSFTVAAQSKAELAPMYRKLNFLASNLAPDYSEYGYMRGPLVTLTVGGYFYNQPGFITGLTYEMSEETPWEIGINETGDYDKSVKELTHIIKVSSFAFTPIHTFPVRKQINNYGGTDGKVTKNGYGKERYIALKTGDNNLYGEGKPYDSPVKDANSNTPDPTKTKTNPQVGTVPQNTQLLATPTYGTTPNPISTPTSTQGGTGTTGNTGAGQFNWLQK
jgi:hypothetical protein